MTTRRYDEYGLPIPPTFEDDGPSPASRMSARRRRALRALVGLSAFAALGILLWQTPLHKHASRMVSGWLMDRAMDKYMADDAEGALRDLDRAAFWFPDSPDVYERRAEVRLAANDVLGSLADCNKQISLDPQDAGAYLRRAHVKQRLERHQEAIEDATMGVDLAGPFDATALNSRAYIRALANRELEEGLVDIEKALQLQENNAAFLDTRAYLLYQLGRYQPALDDMNRAISEAEARQADNTKLFALRHVPQRKFALFLRLNDENMAVMYHHRGEIHGKLGNSEKAQADLRRGDELGYNPAKGVY